MITSMPSSEASVADLARDGNEAALEGVADLLLGRLLGLAVLVGFLGHARAARQAVMSLRSSAGRSSMSPLATILRTVSTIARRASATSRAGGVPPPCSSASTMRREREASAERMAAWNVGVGALQGEHQPLDRHLVEHGRARAGGGRSARSSKREQHALERLGLVGPHLGEALQHGLRLRLVQAVEDVGDAGARGRRRRGDQLLGAASPRPRPAPRPAPRLDAEHPAQQARSDTSAAKELEGLGRRLRSTLERMSATVCGCSLTRNAAQRPRPSCAKCLLPDRIVRASAPAPLAASAASAPRA